MHACSNVFGKLGSVTVMMMMTTKRVACCKALRDNAFLR